MIVTFETREGLRSGNVYYLPCGDVSASRFRGTAGKREGAQESAVPLSQT